MSQNMSLESIEKYVNEVKTTEVTKDNFLELTRLATLANIDYPRAKKDRKIVSNKIPEIADAIYSLYFIPRLKHLIPELEKDFESMNNIFTDIAEICKYITNTDNYTEVAAKEFFNNLDNLSTAVTFNSPWERNSLIRGMDKDAKIHELKHSFEANGKILALDISFITLSENGKRKLNIRSNENIDFFVPRSNYIPYLCKDTEGNISLFVSFLNELDSINRSKFEFELYMITKIIGHCIPNLENRNYKFNDDRSLSAFTIDSYNNNGFGIYSNIQGNHDIYTYMALFGIVENLANKLSSREYMEKIIDLFEKVIYSKNRYDEDPDDAFMDDNSSLDEEVMNITEFTIKVIKEVMDRFYGINQ